MDRLNRLFVERARRRVIARIQGETCRIEETRRRGELLEVEAVPGLTLEVDEVLPG